MEGLSDEIETLACQDPHCERLMTVPGIGPIISSAMVAASEDPLPLDFRRDRDHHHRIDTLVATGFEQERHIDDCDKRTGALRIVKELLMVGPQHRVHDLAA
jgi:hypothetical protein